MSNTLPFIEERRTLGATGLAVSPIGFGGAPLGIEGYLTTEDRESDAFEDEAIRAIHMALDCGINLFDTAPAYGEGRSERLIGRALEGKRDRAVITTKYTPRLDATPEEWQASFDASLARLKTDHVDVLQLHGGYYSDEFGEELASSGILDWAQEQKAAGKARFVGLTAENSSTCLESLIKTKRFDTLQIAFNVINQSHCDYSRADQEKLTGVIPLARSLGLGILVMRSTTCGFLGALLATQFPEIAPVEAIRLALRFILSVKEVDCALIGMLDRDIVRANAELVVDRANRLDVVALHNRFPRERQ